MTSPPSPAARRPRHRVVLGVAFVFSSATVLIATNSGSAPPHLNPLVARELAGTGDCPKPSLPPDVVLRVTHGGGISGERTQIEVREDGDAFVLSGFAPETNTRRVTLGLAWVESLDRELAATDIGSAPSACYRARLRQADGGGTTISWRHEGRVRAWSADGYDVFPPKLGEAERLVNERSMLVIARARVDLVREGGT